ncbi:MAG: NADH-quinone oxidoreductase subunit H [Elusimicrobia bacterium]|nr:NADH-quinone oxidoreductase subunit H [Elusimicrobiota bacterium]
MNLTLTALCAHLSALLVLPPLLLGIIAKTKAAFGGRKGPPLLQLYYDLFKLLGKGAVYSRTTTWMFRLGPVLSLATALLAGLLAPLVGAAPLSFPGDAVFFAYLLGLGRFVTAAAALDAGSSFEGMGASREVAFASFAEPALILAVAALAGATGSLSLGAMFSGALWRSFGAGIVLVGGALFLVMLAENSRIPVDDPATHLELTMIHEVMVLDHGGPDLAFILYGASVRLLVWSSLLVRLALPDAPGPYGWAAWGAGVAVVGVLIGAVESSMARARLVHVPQFLVVAICAAAFAVMLSLR